MKKIDNIPIAENSGFTPQCRIDAGGEEWFRLPKPGNRLEGLSRTTLTELVVPCAANGYKPAVRSVLIKKRGAIRGIRLIEKQSL